MSKASTSEDNIVRVIEFYKYYGNKAPVGTSNWGEMLRSAIELFSVSFNGGACWSKMVGVAMDAASMDASQTYNTSVPSSKLLSAGVDGSVLWPAGDDGSSNGSWLSSEIID
ncbi:hypothetical protein GWK47_014142 [Chionoecetes opilio]|uniref:Uncharacterized protein n=1 Tax=Chionoecetes opilio TaxID=41210 RepID=A0A8J4XTQ5_CHIOP|nr:hypothetical protein GWK47_014142 [Chionoecetes opilio]